MPFLINQTFFVRDIFIPNLGHQADLDKLNYNIAKYEPQCLLEILGYPLYKAFGAESSQRMTDLLSGAEFYDGQGDVQKWQGLKHDTDISLIANYIYYYAEKYKASFSNGVGTGTPKHEAGYPISPASHMSEAWNFFSSEVEQMTAFLWLKKIDGIRVYPEFSFNQFCETRRISRRIDDVFSF